MYKDTLEASEGPIGEDYDCGNEADSKFTLARDDDFEYNWM